MQRSALCRSRRELSNEYLLTKIGVDTAENEPLEVWGKIQFIIHLPPYRSDLADGVPRQGDLVAEGDAGGAPERREDGHHLERLDPVDARGHAQGRRKDGSLRELEEGLDGAPWRNGHLLATARRRRLLAPKDTIA